MRLTRFGASSELSFQFTFTNVSVEGNGWFTLTAIGIQHFSYPTKTWLILTHYSIKLGENEWKYRKYKLFW